MSAHSERVCGIRVIANLLACKPHLVQSLWSAAGRRDARSQCLAALAEQAGITVQQASPRALEKLAGSARHQGWVAQFRPDNLIGERSLPGLLQRVSEPAVALMLDRVQDPHNLGACLRSAEAAGAALVILPGRRAAGLTPAARRAACGAAELLPICQIANLARAMHICREADFWIIGTGEDADAGWYDLDPPSRILLVMGGEEQGLRQLTRKHCDQLLRLPTHGRIGSLNVSVATGICLFDLRRRWARSDTGRGAIK